jgi:Uma2 family endonuclease
MWDGMITFMSPAPSIRHYELADNIRKIFERYFDGKRCRVFKGEVLVRLSDKDSFVPDIAIVCNQEIIKELAICGPPDLIVEVLSRSTAKKDKGRKKDLCEFHGVKEYWLVDPRSDSIETYILRDGKYQLDNIYQFFSEGEMEYMTEEEKAEITYKFKTSLFDDLIIDINEVFKDIEI